MRMVSSRAGRTPRRDLSRAGLKREGVAARRLYEALFLDALLDAIASDGRQTVDEQHAVQVIDLVLNHLGSQPLRLERNRPSCLVLGRYTDPLAPLDVGEDARQGETTLLLADGATAIGDDRVDQRARSALAVVHYDDPQGDAHLGGGEADADLVPHALDHVGDDRPDLGRHR